MSFAVITDADVVTCCRGVSVRVEVTKTGGSVGSCGSATGSLENDNQNRNKRSKPTFMETSFSRERGVVVATRTGLLA
jgi:hypothetical protein